MTQRLAAQTAYGMRRATSPAAVGGGGRGACWQKCP